ncbi:3-isopropylmalate dehydratase small subunit, partial [Salmonella enterica subsp. enterica serovar Infantis]
MAEKYTQHTGLVVPLAAANVVTDACVSCSLLRAA